MPSVGAVYFRHYLLCLYLLTHQVSQLLECFRYGMVFSLFLLTKKGVGVTEKNVGAVGGGEGEEEGGVESTAAAANAADAAAAAANAAANAVADDADAEGWGEGEGGGKPSPMTLASILELLRARAEVRTQREFQPQSKPQP